MPTPLKQADFRKLAIKFYSQSSVSNKDLSNFQEVMEN